MKKFLLNKYTTCYFSLIKKYDKTSDVSERHHIIPKSLGGANDESNIAHLPLRVHFIAHKLLIRMTAGKSQQKMWYALFQMMNRRICHFSSRDYANARIRVSHYMTCDNPMKRSDVVTKRIGVKRPEQSSVAKERNTRYWASRGRPIRVFNCPGCSKEIKTRIPEKRSCNKDCAKKARESGR